MWDLKDRIAWYRLRETRRWDTGEEEVEDGFDSMAMSAVRMSRKPYISFAFML